MFKTMKNLTLVRSAILSCCLTNTALALNFSDISEVYFFGDSLTDSGFNNLIPLVAPGFPVGKAPTFTTYGGYVWAQYVAHDIKGYPLPVYDNPMPPNPDPADTITNNTTPLIPGLWPVLPDLMGVDYACGGSTTDSFGYGPIPWAPSLDDQVTHFLATQPLPLDPNALYFIWSGANDFFTTLESPNPDQLALLETANTAAHNIADEVRILSKNGAKRVVIFALPNLGIAPQFQAAGQLDPSIPPSLKTVSFTFNSFINQYVGEVIKTNPVKVLYIDTYELLDQVILATAAGKPYIVNGQPFYFTNYTTPACDSSIPMCGPSSTSALFCPANAPAGHIFADCVHPTDEAHQLIAAYVEEQIAKWA